MRTAAQAEEQALHHCECGAGSRAKISHPSEPEPLDKYRCLVEFCCYKQLCRTLLLVTFGIGIVYNVLLEL